MDKIVSQLKNLGSLDRNTIVTGQLFFRHGGPAMESDMSYRQVFMICGLLALPVGCEIKGEHQYSVAGIYSPENDSAIIAVDMQTETDLTDIAMGNTLTGLLRSPIWRI